MKTDHKEELFLSREIYSDEALSLAAAVFEDRAEVALSRKRDGTAVSGAHAGEFANEALNQQCRLDLGRRNSRLASLITTKALLSAAGERPSKRAGK